MIYGLALGAAVKMFLVPICVQRKKIRSVLSKMEDQVRMLLNARPGYHGYTETVPAVLSFITALPVLRPLTQGSLSQVTYY